MKTSHIVLMAILIAEAQMPSLIIAQGNLQEAKPEKIPFCDLAMRSEKYDGHLILTEAVASNSFHSILLFDPLCSETRGRGGMHLSAQPTFESPYKMDSPLDTQFRKVLGEEGSVRIIFVGVVESLSQAAYGPEGRLFEIHIRKLISVHPITPAERQALEIGTAVKGS